MALDAQNKIINAATGIVVDGTAVEGGYFVTESIEVTSTGEAGKIPTYACIEGALCYCTGDFKFYQYNGTAWVEAQLGGSDITIEDTTSAAIIALETDNSEFSTKIDAACNAGGVFDNETYVFLEASYNAPLEATWDAGSTVSNEVSWHVTSPNAGCCAFLSTTKLQSFDTLAINIDTQDNLESFTLYMTTTDNFVPGLSRLQLWGFNTAIDSKVYYRDLPAEAYSVDRAAGQILIKNPVSLGAYLPSANDVYLKIQWNTTEADNSYANGNDIEGQSYAESVAIFGERLATSPLVYWNPEKNCLTTAPIEAVAEKSALQGGTRSQALSRNAFTYGHENIAGGKGFLILNTTNNNDGTGTYKLSSVTGLKINDKYSVMMDDYLYNIGSITAIDNTAQTVTVSDYPNELVLTAVNVNHPALGQGTVSEGGFHKTAEFDSTSPASLDNYLTIVGRPDLGDYDVAFNAVALHECNLATERSATALGRGSKATAPYAFASGRLAKAFGHSAHAEGFKTTASGISSHAEGRITNATHDGTHAEGIETQATQRAAHAEGEKTEAFSASSHAEGYNTHATELAAHAEGYHSTASNKAAHAEGESTTASGLQSHAEGYDTTASAKAAHAEGNGTQATAEYAHAEGGWTTASEYGAHAEGRGTKAENKYSHTEGDYTTATGIGAHAEGLYTVAQGHYSHAEGKVDSNIVHTYSRTVDGVVMTNDAHGESAHREGVNTTAWGAASHAEGGGTAAKGDYSHAEGYNTNAIGHYSHTEGYCTTASSDYSHAEGYRTAAWGKQSHAEGYNTNAVGVNSHAEGYASQTGGAAVTENTLTSGTSTTAGSYAHVEGNATLAQGVASHAEGKHTLTLGNSSHAEGDGTVAAGGAAHAEGYRSKTGGSDTENTLIEGTSAVSGAYAHAEGNATLAQGRAAHAEGQKTFAKANYSHAGGLGTIATVAAQTVIGKYNAINANALFIIGKGSSNARSNALTVDTSGNAVFAGTIKGTTLYEGGKALSEIYALKSEISTGSSGITVSTSEPTNDMGEDGDIYLWIEE